MALLYTLGGAYANFPEVVRFGCIHRRHLRRSLLLTWRIWQRARLLQEAFVTAVQVVLY